MRVRSAFLDDAQSDRSNSTLKMQCSNKVLFRDTHAPIGVSQFYSNALARALLLALPISSQTVGHPISQLVDWRA